MEYTKAAAVVAGVVTAVGVASPAMAVGLPGTANQVTKPVAKATKATPELSGQLGALNTGAIVGQVSKAADALTTQSNTAVGDAVDTAVNATPGPMVGGLPAGVPLG